MIIQAIKDSTTIQDSTKVILKTEVDVNNNLWGFQFSELVSSIYGFIEGNIIIIGF